MNLPFIQNTPLHIAIENRQEKIIELFLGNPNILITHGEKVITKN